MSNERDDRSIGKLSEWCVGEEPKSWDVSFGARITEQLRRWLGLSAAQRQPGAAVQGERTGTMRKAA